MRGCRDSIGAKVHRLHDAHPGLIPSTHDPPGITKHNPGGPEHHLGVTHSPLNKNKPGTCVLLAHVHNACIHMSSVSFILRCVL